MRGDFHGLMDPGGGEADALDAQALLALATDRAPPDVDSMRAARAQRGLRVAALRALLDEDEARLSAIGEAQRAVGAPASAAAITEGWRRLMRGEPAAPDGDADGPGRIELVAQRALGLLEAGDVEEATTHARRATRMARTEGFVFLEYLASIVLARVRRHAGSPHLAARILSTLARVAPGPWRGWIDYELAMTGEASAGPHRWTATRALHGEAVEVRFAPAARELAAITAACRPALAAPPAMRAWLEGRVTDAPGAVVGLSQPAVDGGGREWAGVFVLATGPGRARRLLRAGLDGLALPESHRLDEPYKLNQARPFLLLAELAFAPGPVAVSALFERIYGFGYQPTRHGAVLRMLVRRAREKIPEGASIERGDDGLWLDPGPGLAFPDPRCGVGLEGLVLRSLASRDGKASASELADALGVSSRTVQTIVKGLVEDGVCEVVGKGRASHYKLEDTTFWEPTIERMSPRGVAAAER